MKIAGIRRLIEKGPGAAVVVALALFLCAARPALAAVECPVPDEDPVVDVRIDSVLPRENTSLSAAQIGKMFDKSAHVPHVAKVKGVRIGLTENAYKGLLRLQLGGTYDVENDAACLSVRKITYTIRYRPRVYIASDILKMPCRYRETVRHEKHHMETFLDVAHLYRPKIQRAIEDFFAEQDAPGPVSKRHINTLKQETLAALTAHLRPTIEAFKQEDFSRQRAIDTPENYAREDAACHGEKVITYNR